MDPKVTPDQPPPIRPLHLDDSPTTGTIFPDACIAHLKLLASISDLRDSISTANDLFTVSDDQALHFARNTSNTNDPNEIESLTSRALALCREKRWEIYVCRAVERFTVWLESVVRVDEGLRGSSRGLASVEDVERGMCAGWTGWRGRVRWGHGGVSLPPLGMPLVFHLTA